jgi:hypothetical protein
VLCIANALNDDVKWEVRIACMRQMLCERLWVYRRVLDPSGLTGHFRTDMSLNCSNCGVENREGTKRCRGCKQLVGVESCPSFGMQRTRILDWSGASSGL